MVLVGYSGSQGFRGDMWVLRISPWHLWGPIAPWFVPAGFNTEPHTGKRAVFIVAIDAGFRTGAQVGLMIAISF